MSYSHLSFTKNLYKVSILKVSDVFYTAGSCRNFVKHPPRATFSPRRDWFSIAECISERVIGYLEQKREAFEVDSQESWSNMETVISINQSIVTLIQSDLRILMQRTTRTYMRITHEGISAAISFVSKVISYYNSILTISYKSRTNFVNGFKRSTSSSMA